MLEDAQRAVSASFPVTVGDATVEVVEILSSTADEVRLLARLIGREGDEVVDVKEQEVRVDGGASRIAAAAGWVRAALEGVGDPGDWFPSDLFAEPCPYEPVGPFAASDRRLYLDAVRWAVREQAQRRGFAARFDVLRFWSPPARAVYFADLLDAMVGGNGLEGFLHQAPVEDVMGGLEALVALGCARLCQRYREGLTVAAREGGEFVYSVDERWLARERAPTAPAGARPWWVIDSWDEGGSYWLLKHELAPSLDAFVERHGAALLRSA